MENKDIILYISYGIMAVFWLLAYVLIVRRGFVEKTFGMPIVAMMGNWAWEWIFGFGFYSSCPPVWDHCPRFWFQLCDFLAAFFDLFIVYTIFRFGRDKISNPFFRKYYYPILAFGIAAAFAIQYPLVSEIGLPNPHRLSVGGTIPGYLPGDQGGEYTGFILGFLMGILFIQMITERDSLEGQSFIIAVCMLLGNVAALVFVEVVETDSPLLNVIMVLTLFTNLVYAILAYKKSLALKINPWRRW